MFDPFCHFQHLFVEFFPTLWGTLFLDWMKHSVENKPVASMNCSMLSLYSGVITDLLLVYTALISSLIQLQMKCKLEIHTMANL